MSSQSSGCVIALSKNNIFRSDWTDTRKRIRPRNEGWNMQLMSSFQTSYMNVPHVCSELLLVNRCMWLRHIFRIALLSYPEKHWTPDFGSLGCWLCVPESVLNLRHEPTLFFCPQHMCSQEGWYAIDSVPLQTGRSHVQFFALVRLKQISQPWAGRDFLVLSLGILIRMRCLQNPEVCWSHLFFVIFRMKFNYQGEKHDEKKRNVRRTRVRASSIRFCATSTSPRRTASCNGNMNDQGVRSPCDAFDAESLLAASLISSADAPLVPKQQSRMSKAPANRLVLPHFNGSNLSVNPSLSTHKRHSPLCFDKAFPKTKHLQYRFWKEISFTHCHRRPLKDRYVYFEASSRHRRLHL